jgi:hypothetical protein
MKPKKVGKKTPPPKPAKGERRSPKAIRKAKTGLRWEMVGAIEFLEEI